MNTCAILDTHQWSFLHFRDWFHDTSTTDRHVNCLNLGERRITDVIFGTHLAQVQQGGETKLLNTAFVIATAFETTVSPSSGFVETTS